MHHILAHHVVTHVIIPLAVSFAIGATIGAISSDSRGSHPRIIIQHPEAGKLPTHLKY